MALGVALIKMKCHTYKKVWHLGVADVALQKVSATPSATPKSVEISNKTNKMWQMWHFFPLKDYVISDRLKLYL